VTSPKRYPPGLRERAVRLAVENREPGALKRIAASWGELRDACAGGSARPSPTAGSAPASRPSSSTSSKGSAKRTRSCVAPTRSSTASAYFAQELDPRRPR
jgi:hypothetical protein